MITCVRSSIYQIIINEFKNIHLINIQQSIQCMKSLMIQDRALQRNDCTNIFAKNFIKGPPSSLLQTLLKLYLGILSFQWLWSNCTACYHDRGTNFNCENTTNCLAMKMVQKVQFITKLSHKLW